MPAAVLLVLVGAPALARAEASLAVDVAVDVHVNVAAPAVAYVPPPPPSALRGSRWELGIALGGGSFGVDDIGGGQLAVRATLGRQFGPLRLAAEVGAAKLWGSRDVYDADGWWNGWEDFRGESRRIGATARLRTGMQADASMPTAELGLFVEGGIGREQIHWSGGGSDERTDAMLGAGFEIAGGAHRMGGFELGVRVHAAPTTSRADDTHDLAIVGYMGALFGS